MIYQIKQGDQLGTIAASRGLSVNDIMKLNPTIKDPNLIQAGASLNLPDTPIVSTGSPTPLKISTSNPALKGLFDIANQTIADFTAKGGMLTPQSLANIQKINDAETQKLSAIASGRSAAENKDAGALDTAIKTADTTESDQNLGLTSLLGELKTARESYITSLAPTQAETDLQTKLNTLRTERQLLPIELRQEGISAPGIAGRQVEDERVRAIQEQNLLLELGLKQDARKMETTAKEKQVSFIIDDITLRTKIEEMLQKQEDKVVEQARNLRKDSLSALSDIVDSFRGLAYEDLDAETQSDILDITKKFQIPPNLLSGALKIAKQQQVFENALKLAQEKRLGADENDVDKRQTKKDLADLLGQVASYGNRDEALSELNNYQSSITTKIGQEGLNQLQQEVDRLFPPPKEEPKEEIGGGILGAVGGFFSRLFQR